MKRFTVFILMLIAAVQLHGQMEKDTVRALFIGNSFTGFNFLPGIVEKIADSMGDKLIFEAMQNGGFTLGMHFNDPITRSEISKGGWDYVILQEQSQIPSFPYEQYMNDYFPNVIKMDSLIKAHNPQSRTMFYMTWGYKYGDEGNCPYFPPVCTYNGMDSLLNLRYRIMADSTNGIVSPVGAVWHNIIDNYPSIELYSEDNRHPALAGSYAGAVCFYTALFRKSPIDIKYNSTLNESVTSNIKKSVKEVVYDNLQYWHIDYPAVHSFTFNDRNYELVTKMKTWKDAAQYAKDRNGRLVHIDSKEEQEKIYNEISEIAKIPDDYTMVQDGGLAAYVWIGGTDQNNEGKWLWDGDDDNSGMNFWNGQGSGGASNGKTFANMYINWGGNNNGKNPFEPDNFLSKQNACAMALSDWPKGFNPIGYASQWNDIDMDNELFFVIEYDFDPIPASPEKPIGPNQLCSTPEDTEYEIEQIDRSLKYIWNVEPETAGNMTISNDKLVVKWTNGFTGLVHISVAAFNDSGMSMFSDSLEVVVKSKPDVPNKPIGDNELCINPENSVYSISPINDAENYIWYLEPSEAGELVGDSTSATVNWNDDFIGEVELKVSAVNDCGESEYSKILNINISNVPDKPSMPEGNDLTVNTAENIYTIPLVENTDRYLWTLTPEEAGSMDSYLNRAEIKWSNDFSGEAELFVVCKNSCGESEESAHLVIAVERETSVNSSEQKAVLSVYPNPIEASSTIEFYVEHSGIVKLAVRNIMGQEIKVLTNKYFATGYYRLKFATEHLQSGMYMMTMAIGDRIASTIVMVTK